MQSPLLVTTEEAGQKLLQFLLRRLQVSQPQLHKWIRTGQVRINGKRAQPFDRVEAQDSIRVPPFVLLNDNQNEEFQLGIPIVYEDSELLVLNKPAGLPVQGGSSQTESVTSRLKEAYKNAPFMPTAAHRLDKDVSGLLLVGKTYSMLQSLHSAFADKENTQLEKYYLALVQGNVEKEGIWEDYLSIEQDSKGYEKTVVTPQGLFAKSEVRVIEYIENRTLIQIKLITGRKHQIRVQCAFRGHSIVGDIKYAGPKAERLFLHATKVIWNNQCFEVSPPW